MKRILILLIVGCTMILHTVSGQTKVVTTGNNLVNPSDPYAADIVIGSDQGGGIRHNSSMMWWSSGSASRISNTGDIFYLSQWSATTPNIGLSAVVGGNSYFKGNVGIKTLNPIADFQVGNATASVSLGSAAAANLNYGSGYIGFNAARSAGSWTISGDNSHNGGGVIYSDLFGNIYMATIASNGGTNQTIADLDIKSRISFSITPTGLVRAKQIKVELNNWPDFVFKKNYQLPSLQEVKAYIDQNQHLPDVPSEQEMVKNGLNVGEMNKLLMKKVEELTLYLIEQNKRIEKLESQLNKTHE